LVFYAASPRHISIAQAQEIVAALPAFTTVVALFVDATEEQIRDVIAQVAIDVLQFHGDESCDECHKKPNRWHQYPHKPHKQPAQPK
jgi:phosphoribosylanthranilate isomerase